jgi:predicted SAM-dependent methyltransferase
MRKTLGRVKRRVKSTIKPLPDPLREVRYALASRYLKGTGLEIGALHYPLKVPTGVTVKYVDRYSNQELREHYPELASVPFVPVSIVDDGEKLRKVKANSQDFIIANHFIEHTQDPIGTIKTHLGKLKDGGVLYLAVPDKRYTFDYDRPVTPLVHLVKDYRKGPAYGRRAHYQEWVKLVEKEKKDVPGRVRFLMDEDYSIHFHVWTNADFAAMLAHAKNDLKLPLELEAIQKNHHEFICIIRKQAKPVPRPTVHGKAKAYQGTK